MSYSPLEKKVNLKQNKTDESLTTKDKTITGAINENTATLDKKANLVNGKIPADELPSMNFIPTGEKGQANGIATLDKDVKVPIDQIPENKLKGTIKKINSIKLEKWAKSVEFSNLAKYRELKVVGYNLKTFYESISSIYVKFNDTSSNFFSSSFDRYGNYVIKEGSMKLGELSRYGSTQDFCLNIINNLENNVKKGTYIAKEVDSGVFSWGNSPAIDKITIYLSISTVSFAENSVFELWGVE